jgi:hypothetical protein
MKAFSLAAAILLLLSACSQRNETPLRPISEIKGKPINSISSSTTATNLVAEVKPFPTPAPTTNSAPQTQNGYTHAGFDKLSAFHYIMPDEISETNKPPADQFPAAVRALDQKPVTIRGFMLPLRVEKGLVTEMLIMKDQSMCCYGTSPKITEWINVKMNDKGVKPIMDQPVTLFGKLHVGETHENGYLVGLYQLDGEKMEWE